MKTNKKTSSHKKRVFEFKFSRLVSFALFNNKLQTIIILFTIDFLQRALGKHYFIQKRGTVTLRSRLLSKHKKIVKIKDRSERSDKSGKNRL